jgi:DNA-binding response OmpR family regulator
VVAGRRILVVDDELPIRALTSEILSHAGYLVNTAASGDKALRRLKVAPYDLVVADMRMPGMDGATMYEQMCDRWPRMESRIVFITGDVEGERTSRRLARGDVRYLEKPFDTSALLRRIRSVLDAHAPAAE